MVVMGIDNICKDEGIILGGLVVVAGAVMVLMIVSGVIRELGARKKGSTSPSQSEVTEAPKKEEVPVQQEDEENQAVECVVHSNNLENLRIFDRRGTTVFFYALTIGLAICILIGMTIGVRHGCVYVQEF